MVLRVHLIPFFGNRRLDQITPMRVEAYKADRLEAKLKASTINCHLAILQTLLRSAVEWSRLDAVPSFRPLPSSETDFDWLRPGEAAQLLDAAASMSPKWHAFFFVALRTGMRKGEIMALHWADVDLDERRVCVRYSVWRGVLGPPKSGKTRMVPMTGDLAAALRRWRMRSSGPLVFPGRAGGLSKSHATPNQALDRALARAELRRVRFHDLRHSFASHLVLKRCSLREVQLLLGHYSITMTERYAHVADDHLARAIGVLDGLGHSDGEGEDDADR